MPAGQALSARQFRRQCHASAHRPQFASVLPKRGEAQARGTGALPLADLVCMRVSAGLATGLPHA